MSTSIKSAERLVRGLAALKWLLSAWWLITAAVVVVSIRTADVTTEFTLYVLQPAALTGGLLLAGLNFVGFSVMQHIVWLLAYSNIRRRDQVSAILGHGHGTAGVNFAGGGGVIRKGDGA